MSAINSEEPDNDTSTVIMGNNNQNCSNNDDGDIQTSGDYNQNTDTRYLCKRRLPLWMETERISKNGASPSKKTKTDENRTEETESVVSADAESSSNDHNAVQNGNSVGEEYSPANEEAAQPVIKTEPMEPDEPCSSIQSIEATVKTEIKTEQKAFTATSSVAACSNSDIKPAVKVEKADASSTSRESCKYGIRCYRRNPMHRVEEAHPGDQDYTRPQYPAPPDGTPNCPYGNRCYRRNPVHFKQYNHPDDTDFEKNYRKYRLRQRRKQQQQINENDGSHDSDNTDLDDYDLDDPFINDEDSDLDYLPSDDEGESDDFDYDYCDRAEE